MSRATLEGDEFKRLLTEEGREADLHSFWRSQGFPAVRNVRVRESVGARGGAEVGDIVGCPRGWAQGGEV